MIFLLPFLNAFLLYICIQPKQLLTNAYYFVMENLVPRLPKFIISILGACLLCTATWMGIVEIGIWNLIKHSIYSPEKYILVLVYNAVSTTILYKLMK